MNTQPNKTKQIEYLLNKRTIWNRWIALGGKADLSGANLSEADLYRATLSRADLYGANLSRADLSGSDLSGATLSEADLSNTCLDSTNPTSDPVKVRKFLAIWGITPNKHGSFIAYRTKQSQYVGNTIYQTGKTYQAPYFSTDENTDCHPGLYFSNEKVARAANSSLITVVINIKDVVIGPTKARCKKFRVVKDIK